MIRTRLLPGCAAFAMALSLAACDSSTATGPAAQSLAQNMAGTMAGVNGMASVPGVPNVSGANASNIAGVLGYCQNAGATATGTSSPLLAKLSSSQPGVTSNAAYTAGTQGVLQTSTAQPFSLTSLSQPLKQQVCSMIENRAQSLIGGAM